MSSTSYKISYHDYMAMDMNHRDGMLYILEHHTSGVNTIWDESGKVVFQWGGDCSGDKESLIAQIVLSGNDDLVTESWHPKEGINGKEIK